MRALWIRVDTSLEMGIGHGMRCLALAEEWRAQGGKVTFVVSSLTPAFESLLEEKGFTLSQIPVACPDIRDITAFKNLLKREGKAMVVLDGYHFTPDYQAEIRALSHSLLVIDDNHHLTHYNADFVLNPNPESVRLNYISPTKARLLLGKEYILLREEFRQIARSKKVIEGRAKKIFITLGGTEQSSLVAKTIEALTQEQGGEVVVIGKGEDTVRVFPKSNKCSIQWSIQFFPIGSSLIPWMKWADLVISGAGGTAWELCYLGIPAVFIIVAENQRANAMVLSPLFHGSCRKNVILGDQEHLDVNTLKQWIHNADWRTEMVKQGTHFVDGQGVKRVVAALRE